MTTISFDEEDVKEFLLDAIDAKNPRTTKKILAAKLQPQPIHLYHAQRVITYTAINSQEDARAREILNLVLEATRKNYPARTNTGLPGTTTSPNTGTEQLAK